MPFFEELGAKITIFISNFVARFGLAFNLFLCALVVALIVLSFVRTRRMSGKYTRKNQYRPLVDDKRISERAAKVLSEAVRIKTVTGDAQAVRDFIELIKHRYASALAKMSCLYMPQGGVLLHWRSYAAEKKPPVLLCGHIDVVPPGDGWAGDPFSGEIRDGMIYGRGSLDCKGPVVALLEAADELIKDGFAPERDIYFAFGHDEETGGTNGAGVLSGLMTRRGLRFDMVLGEGSFIEKDHMGKNNFAAALIGVGEKGSGNLRLTAEVKGGAAAAPRSQTALGVLSEAVCRIEALRPKIHILDEVRRYLSLSMEGMSLGKRWVVANLPLTRFLLSRAFRRDPETMALLRTTLAPTQAHAAPAPNMLSEKAEATINCRIIQGDNAEKLYADVSALLSDLPVTVAFDLLSKPSSISPAGGEMYDLLCSAVGEHFSGAQRIPTLLQGMTDCKYYEPLSDNVYRFTPITIGGRTKMTVHGKDEQIAVHKLGAAVGFYMTLMRKL